MAAFSRGPDINGRLCDVIESLQSDAAQGNAEIEVKLLLERLNRLLASEPPGMDRINLERLRGDVRNGRAEILGGDRALALKRFKEALEYWMKPAKKGER
jgi:hypothetical protein